MKWLFDWFKRRQDAFDTAVLEAVKKAGPNAYGVTIRDALGEALGRDVSIGAMYTALERLERKGLLRSWEGEATAERGWRKKRHYAVSP